MILDPFVLFHKNREWLGMPNYFKYSSLKIIHIKWKLFANINEDKQLPEICKMLYILTDLNYHLVNILLSIIQYCHP